MKLKKQTRAAKIKAATNKIVEIFKSGMLPEAIKTLAFPSYQVPSNKWSLTNRLIIFKSGTADARGFKMWSEKKRKVKKGSKAIYILAPRIIKTKEDEEELKTKCIGFRPIPVFPVEMTEGEPLDYKLLKVPNLHFLGVAKKWGINVKAIPYVCNILGYYKHKVSEHSGEIFLASPEEEVFFHELAHCAHHKIDKSKMGTKVIKEVTAELSAQILGLMINKKVSSKIGNSWEYIRDISKKQPEKIIFQVLPKVEKVVDLILKESEAVKPL